MSNIHRLILSRRISFACVNPHPAIERFNKLQFAQRPEISGASRRRLQWTRIAPTLTTILLAALAVYAQTRSEVIPIRIAVGESVTLERPAAKGDDVFELTARAGQTLALEEDGYWPASADRSDIPHVRVFLADSTHTKDVEGSQGCVDWRWIGVLPTSGVYHIVVSRRSEKRYRLRISLLDPDDPIFDPGLRADRISIGEGLFPPGSKLALERFNPHEYVWYCEVYAFGDEGLPAHLRLQDKYAWLGVMSLEGLKKANPPWVMDGDLARLERALRTGAMAAEPPLGSFDDARLMHWGRLERFEAKSWRGLRWLAQFSQEDEDELRNPLMYVFAAISNDGKYFIWLWADIDYLNAPPDLSQLTDEQMGQLGKTWETFQSKVRTALTNASPKSFKPDLDQLDGVVRSLDLR